MDSFNYGKALSEMWTLGGKAFLDAQQQALRAMRDGAAAMGLPAAATMGLPAGMAGGGLPGAAGLPGAGLPGAMPPGAAGLAPPAFPNLAFDAGEIGKAGQALAELWTAASDLAAALARRLPQPAPQGADAAATQAGADSTVAATLRRMVDPRVWLGAGDDMEEALQRMAQGPRFADLWDNERRFAGVFGAWMALRRRGLEHQAVVLEGWTTAAGRFAERLGERAAAAAAAGGEASPPVLSPRAALDLWIETANRALLEMQRSERYLESQAQLLKASTELRLAQQAVAEHYGRMFGLPTRTELDDVHRTVTELRRALRATQRRLRQQQPPPPQQAATEKPAPDRPARAAPARATPATAAPATAATLRASRPAARRGKKTET